MRADAEGLAASTSDTAALAEKVSHKVRQLDLAQSRVGATLERISLVVDRLRAIEGIQAALAAEDYEAAAGCVERYLELQEAWGDALADADARAAQEQAKVGRPRRAGSGLGQERTVQLRQAAWGQAVRSCVPGSALGKRSRKGMRIGVRSCGRAWGQERAAACVHLARDRCCGGSCRPRLGAAAAGPPRRCCARGVHN